MLRGIGTRSIRQLVDLHLGQSSCQPTQTPARLTSKENIILAAFSVLYTINIAVSNLSLKLVTVPVSWLYLGSMVSTDSCH